METLRKIVYSKCDELEQSGVLESGNLIMYADELGSICNSTNAFITIHDLKKLRMAYINDACRDFYGLKTNFPSRLSTALYLLTFHPKTLDLLIKSYDFFFQNNGVGDLKLLYNLKNGNGEYYDVLGHTITCRRASGKPQYALSATYYADRMNDILNPIHQDKNISLLSKREFEILELIYSNKNKHQIAEELFISVETVRTHRKNLMKKLEVSSTVELIKKAAQVIDD